MKHGTIEEIVGRVRGTGGEYAVVIVYGLGAEAAEAIEVAEAI